MQPSKQAIFSEILKAGRFTYFFDVHLDKRNEPYLAINLSSIDENGERKRTVIRVFSRNLEEFAGKVQNIVNQATSYIEERGNQ